MAAPQSFKNHTRWDPIFHFFILPILLIDIPAAGIWVGRHYDDHRRSGPWLVLVTVVLFLLALKTRMYALKAQDRIIRLEEQHRLASLASAEELVELSSLTMPQYVALRFASNPELPALARRAVREKLTPKQIKESIVSWRADNDRI